MNDYLNNEGVSNATYLFWGYFLLISGTIGFAFFKLRAKHFERRIKRTIHAGRFNKMVASNQVTLFFALVFVVGMVLFVRADGPTPILLFIKHLFKL